MNGAEQDLARARQERDAARAALDERLGGLRGSLAEQSVGDRIKSDALVRAKAAADEAIDVAKESRWVIAGTLALILGWVLRQPLKAAARRVAETVRSGEPRQSWRRLRDWTVRKAKP